MKSGRKKIKLADLPKGWEEKMESMSSEGASEVELRTECLGGICHETWTRLIKEEKIFSETVNICRDKCRSWWVKQGRVNLWDKEFSPTLFYMNMKNRFGWKDRHETDQNLRGSIDITVKDALNELEDKPLTED